MLTRSLTEVLARDLEEELTDTEAIWSHSLPGKARIDK
jgi:hypothetical protein